MSNSLKKTTINASYFPDGGQPSTAFTTEDHLDETAPPSIREESNENSAANSFEVSIFLSFSKFPRIGGPPL